LGPLHGVFRKIFVATKTEAEIVASAAARHRMMIRAAFEYRSSGVSFAARDCSIQARRHYQ
jgi:hypothetical protein